MNQHPWKPAKGSPLFRRLVSVLAVVLTPLLWPVGVLLLWLSPVWKRRDKLIGSFILPGGLLFAWFLFTSGPTACEVAQPGSTVVPGEQACPASLAYSLTHPTPSWEFNHIFGALVFLLSIAVPLLSAIYLGIQLARNWGAPSSGADTR